MNVLNVSTQLSSSFHTQLASAKSDLKPQSFFSLMAKLPIEFPLARARATKREIQRPEARLFKGNQTLFLSPSRDNQVIQFFTIILFRLIIFILKILLTKIVLPLLGITLQAPSSSGSSLQHTKHKNNKILKAE